MSTLMPASDAIGLSDDNINHKLEQVNVEIIRAAKTGQRSVEIGWALIEEYEIDCLTEAGYNVEFRRNGTYLVSW